MCLEHRLWSSSEEGPPIVKKGMRITQEQVEAILCEDLKQFEKAVEQSVKVCLTDAQIAALVSFYYNVGKKPFASRPC